MIQLTEPIPEHPPLGLAMSWGAARPAEKWDENHMDHRITGCSELEKSHKDQVQLLRESNVTLALSAPQSNQTTPSQSTPPLGLAMSWGAAIQQRNGMRITRIMGLLDVLGWKKSTSPALKGIKHDLGILSSMIQPTQPIPDHSTPGQSWGNCKNSREMGGSPNYGMFQVGRIPQGSSPALRESKVTLAFPNP